MRLSESTELVALSFLVNASPTAMGLSRLSDKKFAMVNEAFIRLYGYVRDEVSGHSSDELKIWHESQSRSDNLLIIIQK